MRLNMTLQYLVALIMSLFGIGVLTANAAVSTREKNSEIHAEPTAHILLADSDLAYDAQTTMMEIDVNLRQLQSMLRPAFQNRDIDIKQLNQKKNEIAKLVHELTALRDPVKKKFNLSQELQSIDHEMACVDEFLQCANNNTCKASKKKLETCNVFPFHIYRGFASKLAEESTKLLLDAKRVRSHALAAQINVPYFRNKIGEQKHICEVLQGINTTKWANHSTLVNVQELIRRSSRTLEAAEFELELCEKAQIGFIMGYTFKSNSTGLESAKAIYDINSKLHNLEASLLHLMNSEGMSRDNLKKAKHTLEEKFETLRRDIQETGLELSDDSKSTFVKISFLLTTA